MKKNIGVLIDGIEKYLNSGDFVSFIGFKASENYSKLIAGQNYGILVSYFFDYYWSRLPVLLKCNRVIYEGKTYKPSDKVIFAISEKCFYVWSNAYPNLVGSYKFSRTFYKFRKLTKWYVKSEIRDGEVYDAAWLFDSLQKYYPEMTANDNV